MEATVARIPACTFSASRRLHVLPVMRPSAVRVPGEGMLGRLECVVRVRGSKTMSKIGWVFVEEEDVDEGEVGDVVV